MFIHLSHRVLTTLFLPLFIVNCYQSLQVSRRFDSRKFVVRFSAPKSGGNDYDFSGLHETKTTPIEVFSKRKIYKYPDKHDPVPRKRRRFVQIAKVADLDQLKTKYAKLFQEIRNTLEQQVRQSAPPPNENIETIV